MSGILLAVTMSCTGTNCNQAVRSCFSLPELWPTIYNQMVSCSVLICWHIAWLFECACLWSRNECCLRHCVCIFQRQYGNHGGLLMSSVTNFAWLQLELNGDALVSGQDRRSCIVESNALLKLMIWSLPEWLASAREENLTGAWWQENLKAWFAQEIAMCEGMQFAKSSHLSFFLKEAMVIVMHKCTETFSKLCTVKHASAFPLNQKS